jgi:hypothetical protein
VGCLVVAEHRLAEQVDVQADAAAPQLRKRLAELGRGRIDHEVPDHAPEHPARDGHDRPRQDRGDVAPDEDREPQVPGQEARDGVGQLLEVAPGDPQVLRPHHAIHEAEREIEAERVGEQTGEALRAGVGRGIHALGQPATHDRDRFVGKVGRAHG